MMSIISSSATKKKVLLMFVVLTTVVLLGGHPSCAFVPVPTPISRPTPSSSLLLFSTSNSNNKPRRQKVNKYKKASADTKDPLEKLMEESKQKLQEIQQEQSQQKKPQIDPQLLEQRNAPRQFVFPDNKDIDPNDPASFGFIEIGTIVGAHGVHGEVKVQSTSYIPERFTQPGVKWLKPYNKRAPRKVLLVQGRGPTQNDEYILKLEESKTREDAKRLRGGTLFVREEERETGGGNNSMEEDKDEDDEAIDNENVDSLQPSSKEEIAEEEEYFISDLVGLEVFLVSSSSDSDSQENTQHTNPHFVGTVAGVVLAAEMCAIPGLGHDMLEITIPKGTGGTVSLKDELVLVPFVPQIVPQVNMAERVVYIDPPDGLLDLTYIREEKVRIKGFLPPASSESTT